MKATLLGRLAVICVFTATFAAHTSGALAEVQEIPYSQEMYNRIKKDLICLCGCKSVLGECPHVNCDYAIPAREKVKDMLAAGKDYDEIIEEFIKDRGEEALAAPTKSGFNILGYVVPFLAIFAAGYGVSVIASSWASGKSSDDEDDRRGGSADSKQAPQPQASGELADRLKKELEEFDS